MHTDIRVPEAGESITQVELARWLVEDGAFVEKDQEIAEIDSDKATLTISADADGKIQIMVEEGSTVEPGKIIGRIDGSAEGGATSGGSAGLQDQGKEGARSGEAAAGEAARRVGSGEAAGEGPGKELGGKPDEGYAARRAGNGEAAAGDTPRAVGPGKAESAQGADPRKVGNELPAGDARKSDPGAEDMIFSPQARRLLEEEGIQPDWKSLERDGKRITRKDILQAIATHLADKQEGGTHPKVGAAGISPGGTGSGLRGTASGPGGTGSSPGGITSGPGGAASGPGGTGSSPGGTGSSPGGTTSGPASGGGTQVFAGSWGGTRQLDRQKMSALRRKVAERLVAVKNQTAMLTTFNEADMSAIIALRKKYQKAFTERYGFKLGFMSFFVKAVAESIPHFPQVNGYIDGNQIVLPGYADIGIAVSTPKGLMVPVIRNAEQLSVPELEQRINELADRARDNRITIEELSGGTFSITNGGVFGSMLSTPILNPPQSAILGMHNIVERPVAIDGKVEIRPMMYLALSYDHRIIDGKESVSFLVKVKECIEDPSRLFFGGRDPMQSLLGL